MSKIKAILISLRPKNWIKNGFLFIPLIFSGKLAYPGYLNLELLAVIAFSFCSSAIYLFNDIIDFEADKLHSKKSSRPIAKGQLSRTLAAIIGILLLVACLLFSSFFNKQLFIILLGYSVLNLAYSLYLKQLVIIDVMTIAFNFELRIWAGSVVIGVLPSVWLQMMTFLLAFFLAFAKRRHELSSLKQVASKHRFVLSKYRIALVDQFMTLCAGLTIIAYALYTVSSEATSRLGGKYLIYTFPFVVYGIFRYLYLVQVRKKGGDPVEVLLSDFPLLVNLIVWIATVFIILY